MQCCEPNLTRTVYIQGDILIIILIYFLISHPYREDAWIYGLVLFKAKYASLELGKEDV